jgi:hypothetical protein
MLKFSRIEESNRVVKINGKEIKIKGVDQFVYLGSVMERNGKIKYEVNEGMERLWNSSNSLCDVT